MRFVPGEAYFIILYVDEQLAVPVIQTLVYLGETSRGDGGIDYRFKEMKTTEEASLFLVRGEHVDDLVVDRSGLIDRLIPRREGTIGSP